MLAVVQGQAVGVEVLPVKGHFLFKDFIGKQVQTQNFVPDEIVFADSRCVVLVIGEAEMIAVVRPWRTQPRAKSRAML